MTIEEMKAKKKEYGLSCEYIAVKSGVPVSTVRKIFSGITPTPRRITLETLCNFFNSFGEPNITDTFIEGNPEHNFVCEDYGEYEVADGTAALKIEDYSNKTLDDYLALPEGIRVELIDGVFYDLEAPTTIHQRIGMTIARQFEDYNDANDGSCVPFIAPTDVQLDSDDKTIVEPDVLVVCDRNKITKPRIVGAPDFIVEVLSPSNWYHDTQRKLWKYKQAGVREYWIVMPEQMKIHVYEFEKSDKPMIYSFEDEIPVGIWNGKCKVDFKKVYDKISFML